MNKLSLSRFITILIILVSTIKFSVAQKKPFSYPEEIISFSGQLGSYNGSKFGYKIGIDVTKGKTIYSLSKTSYNEIAFFRNTNEIHEFYFQIGKYKNHEIGKYYLKGGIGASSIKRIDESSIIGIGDWVTIYDSKDHLVPSFHFSFGALLRLYRGMHIGLTSDFNLNSVMSSAGLGIILTLEIH